MPGVMMALGGYRFSLDSAAYQTLQRGTTYRWQGQERLLREKAYQFVGPGDDTVTLKGVIHPHFRGGLRQVEAMRAEAGKGEPLTLVDGLGKPWGRYVILQVDETASELFDNGAPRKIEFSLQLKRYGEDDATLSSAVATASVTTAAASAVTAIAAASEAVAETTASIGSEGVLSGLSTAFSVTSEALSTVTASVAAVTGVVEQATGVVNQLLGVGARVCDLAGVSLDGVSTALQYVPGTTQAVASGLASVGADVAALANTFVSDPAQGITTLAATVAAADDPAALAETILPGVAGEALAALAQSAA